MYREHSRKFASLCKINLIEAINRFVRISVSTIRIRLVAAFMLSKKCKFRSHHHQNARHQTQQKKKNSNFVNSIKIHNVLIINCVVLPQHTHTTATTHCQYACFFFTLPYQGVYRHFSHTPSVI